MKKTFYLLFALMIMASTFSVSAAKAQSLPCQGADPISGGCPVSGTTLPINNGVFYLLAAGLIVGTVAIKRYKPYMQKV